MSPLTEQFSEARNLQLETQFKFFSNFTGKAFESAEKIIALNFDTSRASFEKSSALVRQMIAIKDPRDLFALTSQTQSQFDSVLSYGRQLFGIAAGVATAAAPGAADAPALAAPAPVAEPVATPAPSANQWTAAPEIVTPAPEAVVVQAPVADPAPLAEAQPIAEPNPVAKAMGAPEVLQPSAASFPVPSSSKPIEVAPVNPVEAPPPPAPVSGAPTIVTKKAESQGAKGARKK